MEFAAFRARHTNLFLNFFIIIIFISYFFSATWQQYEEACSGSATSGICTPLKWPATVPGIFDAVFTVQAECSGGLCFMEATCMAIVVHSALQQQQKCLAKEPFQRLTEMWHWWQSAVHAMATCCI